MKNYRILSFLMLLALLLCLSTPGFATQDVTEAASTEATEETSPLDQLPTGFERPDAPLEYNFPTDFSVSAKAAALIELNSGAIVYSKDLDRKIYPASLTKMMTCMLALEYGNLEDVLTVSETALQNLSIYGSTAGLKEGEEISLHELLYCIMVSSANEGCNVIGEYISGSTEEFVALMNQKAQELGMTGTHFANAHGLHNENHYTTVRDLLTLARWGWQNPHFREYTTATEHTVPATNLSKERTLHTTNYLTDTYAAKRYFYDKAEGIKTGFTTPAGGCLATTATEGDLSFLCVICGCETLYDSNNDPVDMRFIESKRMLRYGLEQFNLVQVLTDTAMLEQVPVSGGLSDTVIVHPSQNVFAPLHKTCDPEKITLQLRYDRGGSLTAPLQVGEKVGTVTALYEGIVLGTSDLVTLTPVSLPATEIDTPQPSDGGSSEESFGSLYLRLWYITIPFTVVFLLLCLLLILRAINVRKAKKKAARRRSAAARRRKHE